MTGTKSMGQLKKFLIAASLAAAAAPLCGCAGEKDYLTVMAVTGATPQALTERVPAGTALEVTGLTKRTYRFTGDALNALAPTCLRTREVSPQGEFEGTYRYSAISVVNLLEGIAPENEKGAVFDRPLDMIVTFTGRDGKEAHFGYGELTMVDDTCPPVLAFHRAEVRPSEGKDGTAYDKNRHRGALKGLRLVCPAEPDTARYLDDVVKITLRRPSLPDAGLPAMKKGARCSTDAISGYRNGKWTAVSFNGVARDSVRGWVRTGHGKGYKGISSAEGFSLISLIQKNFPGAGKDDYFLFVACDGYRAIFSGRELFTTGQGARIMVIDRMDGKTPQGGLMLGPVADYFVDRDVWGLSHIVVLDKI